LGAVATKLLETYIYCFTVVDLAASESERCAPSTVVERNALAPAVARGEAVFMMVDGRSVERREENEEASEISHTW